MSPRYAPKPEWLKVRAPGGDRYHGLKRTLGTLDLHTVCEEARCPNVGECWREGTATIMLLGDVCTRGCRFCAVTTGDPQGAVDTREPEHVARAIAKLDLSYVVLTMVNRDDLLDGGAEHVARTVTRLRELRGDILIETLVGDFSGRTDAIEACIDGAPDVFAHNIETVRRLTRRVRDVRSSYEQSLEVLRRARARADEPNRARPMLTKSSIMVGLGETDDEVLEAMSDLRAAGVNIVTIGQYLRPSPKHHEVLRFVEPAMFDRYAAHARELGFLYAASGPLVRSSYKAAEVFVRSMLTARGDGSADGAVDAELASRREAARIEAARVEVARVEGAGEGTLIPTSSLVRSGSKGVAS
ncbi:MAG: lipoyl synthase [Polyangiaceae bacterium]